jgi:hypothetical protein
VSAALKRKPKRCAATRVDGNRCTVHVISSAGAVRLLDAGIALVATPTDYCSMHCRTPAARREMSRKGGHYSPKQAAVNQKAVAREKPAMPDEITIKSKTLIRELLAAKLPGLWPAEPDTKRVALGAYLAMTMFDAGDNGEFMLSLMPRGLEMRAHELEAIAQEELRDAISQLEPEEQTTGVEAAG